MTRARKKEGERGQNLLPVVVRKAAPHFAALHGVVRKVALRFAALQSPVRKVAPAFAVLRSGVKKVAAGFAVLRSGVRKVAPRLAAVRGPRRKVASGLAAPQQPQLEDSAPVNNPARARPKIDCGQTDILPTHIFRKTGKLGFTRPRLLPQPSHHEVPTLCPLHTHTHTHTHTHAHARCSQCAFRRSR